MVLARTRRQRLFDRDVERESSAFGDGPSVLEQLREEERVRERNLALRRAAEAVDGGPNDIAKIDALVSGSPLAAPELARGRSEGERKPIAKSVASTLPMGIETYDSFNRERELAERNAPIRQALLSIGTDPDDPDFLGGNATPRTGAGTNRPAQEATSSRRVPLTELPVWVQRGLVAQGVEIPGVAPARTPAQEAAGRANHGTVNPGPGGFDSPPMRTRQEIIDDEARTEILGNPNPGPGGFDSPPMRTREEAERSDSLVPERLIEIFKSPNLIFTREQLDYINGFRSQTVARAQFIAIAESSGKQGEADALRRGGSLPGATPDIVPDAVAAAFGGVADFSRKTLQTFLEEVDEVRRQEVERQRARLEAGRQALEFGAEAVESVLSAKAEQVRRESEAYRAVGEEVAKFAGDRVGDVSAVAGQVKALLENAPDEILELLNIVIDGGCLARERVHQALLGFVTYNPLETDIDETWPARMADGLSGGRTFDGENNRWLEIYPNDPLGRDRMMAGFTEWITDPITIA